MAFRKAVLWSVSGQAISYMVLFVGSVIVARIMSPREMGVFAIAMATIGILNVFISFNIGTYIVRERDLTEATLATAFTVNAILGISVSSAIIICSLCEQYLFDSKDIGRVLLPLSLTPLLGIFEFRAAAMLQREMNFRILSIIQSSKGFITTSVVVWLALTGHSYMSLAYGNVVSAIVSVIWTNSVAPHHISFRCSLRGAGQMIRFGIRMMSIGGLATLTARLSDIVLGHSLGLSALGLYSRASSISALVFENIYGAITRVVFVRMSDDYRSTGSIRATFVQSYSLILSILWPLQIGLAILSGPFIYHVYGERWVPASLALSLLMLAQTIVLCFGMNWELFVLKDEIKKQTRFEFLRSIVGLSFFSLGSMINISAAAIGRIAEAVFGFVLYRPHMNRLAEVEGTVFNKIYAESTMLTLAATGPALAMMFLTGWSYRTPISYLATSIAVGFSFWLVGLVSLKHPMLEELKRLRPLFGL